MVCDLARLASKRSRSGAMALSRVATSAQDGMVRQAAAVALSMNAAPLMGCWAAASAAAVSGGTSAAKTSWNFSDRMYRSVPSLPSEPRVGTGFRAVFRSLPANFVPRSASPSPLSGMNADTYTSDVTFGFPAAALPITAPP